MSRIEQLIDDIEAYIEDCKPSAFSSTKVVVNKEELAEMLNELRLQIPEEVSQYKKIINNQDAIMKNAKLKADGMVEAANKLQTQMIDEHEIMQKALENSNQVIENANIQATNILDRATADSQAMKRAILKYSDDMMAVLQDELESMMTNSKQKFETFYNNLEMNYNTITANRNELLSSADSSQD
ncbi:MAG: vacuolar family H+-ATPase subunit H [Lachnospiraceae bacterium]|nr:vacuolar family H+-ATPase subunit H [Lachnospiraceae bacterium]